MLESTRAKEAEVRKDTTQQLDAFRRQQEEAEKAAAQSGAVEAPETETWKTGPRKRKKGRETAIGGVKLRRTSTAEREPVISSGDSEASERPAQSPADDRELNAASKLSPEVYKTPSAEIKDAQPSKSPPGPTSGLGLAAYSSDEDD